MYFPNNKQFVMYFFAKKTRKLNNVILVIIPRRLLKKDKKLENLKTCNNILGLINKQQKIIFHM